MSSAEPFECRGDDIRPTSGIPIETQSKRQRSVEIVSASSNSYTISIGTFSQRTSVMKRRGLSGATMVEDLIFDLEANLSRKEEINPDSGPRRRSLRSIFPPHQVEADAYASVVDDSIKDTHLHGGLKGHPSAQAWKGQVCCLQFSSSRFLFNAYANG